MTAPALPSPKPRRGWLRFSLRTMLIASFLVGSGWLLRAKIPAWRLEYVLDISALLEKNKPTTVVMNPAATAQSPGNLFTISTIAYDSIIPATIGQHYKLYRNDAVWFEFDFPGSRTVVSRLLSPDLTRLLVADACHAALYDLRLRKKLHEWRLAPEPEAAISFPAPEVVYSADGSRIAVIVKEQRWVHILDAQAGTIEKSHDFAIGSNLREAVFSPDAKALLLNSNERLELLDLASGKLRFSHLTPHNTSYSNCTWLEGVPDTIVGNNYREGVEWISAKTGEVVKGVWHIQPRSFEGFSPDGRRFVESLTERQKQGKIAKMTYTVRDSLSGAEIFSTAVPVSDWNEYCIPKISCSDDTSVLTNTEAGVVLWRTASKERVARLQPAEMTALSKLIPDPDPYRGLHIITCMWVKPAQHALGYTAKSTASSDALYVEADEVGGVTRGYFLRRNHPEEWWGLAYTGEFWLLAVLGVAFMWSIFSDWRSFSRVSSTVQR